MSDPIGSVLAQWRDSSAIIGDSQGPRGDTSVRQVPLMPPGPASDTGFADSLVRAVNAVSDSQDRATGTISAFLRGENVELHDVMAASEEAQLSIEMLVQVRNKFLEAYRSLTTMQG